MDFNVRTIVLSRHQVGERDVLATYFTWERGRMQAIVRGTTKTVSSLRPATQPLNEGDALIVERRGTDLLTEWVPVTSFPGIAGDLRRVCLAGYLLRLTSEFTNDYQPEPALYNLLKITLSGLQKNDYCDIIKIVFEWGFLWISGLLFDFNMCVNCGNASAGTDGVLLDIPRGGPVCPRCAPKTGRGHAVHFSLDAVKLGNMINEVLTGVSGDVLSGEEQISSFRKRVQDLHNENRKTRGAAAVQVQKALTRFIQFHVNERAPDWHVRV